MPLAGGNGLLNNLVAYWPSNEAGGANNILDLHSNALHLTQVHSPGADTGKVYATARTFDGANDYAYRNSATLLQAGNVDLTVAVWVYLASTAAERAVVGKYLTTGNQREWVFEWNPAESAFRFIVSTTGANTFVIDADSFGVPTTTTWLMAIVWHDSVADTINVQINNGSVDSAAHSGGIFASTAPFQIGGINGAAVIPWYGRIGPVMMWKSTAGLGGVLTAAQRTALWAAGAGLPYAQFTV